MEGESKSVKKKNSSSKIDRAKRVKFIVPGEDLLNSSCESDQPVSILKNISDGLVLNSKHLQAQIHDLEGKRITLPNLHQTMQKPCTKKRCRQSLSPTEDQFSSKKLKNQKPMEQKSQPAIPISSDCTRVLNQTGPYELPNAKRDIPEHKTKRKLSSGCISPMTMKKSRLNTNLPQSQVLNKKEAQLEKPQIDTRKENADMHSNIPKTDSRTRRTSMPTSEIARLQNLVHEQENHILQLQNQIDNADTHSLSMDFFKQGDAADSSHEFPRYHSSMDRRCFSLEPSSLLGYSTLSLSSFGTENPSEARLMEENDSLRSELQEVKDQVELLEFRLLECTEAEENDEVNPGSSCQTPKCISDDEKRNNTNSPNNDFETKIALPGLVVAECQQNLEKLSQSSLCKELAPFEALIEWASHFNSVASSSTCTNYEDSRSIMATSKNSPSLCMKDEHKKLTTELNELASDLEDCLADSNTSKLELLAAIEKIRHTAFSAGELDSQMSALVKENKFLHDTITTLNDSHETRTEASGTESELVHGKSPSVSSDISDTESEFPAPQSIKTSSIEAASSFQESGIFEGPSESTDISTQTVEMEREETEEIQLQEALDRLRKLQTFIKEKDWKHHKLCDLQESDEYLLKDTDSHIVISREEYDKMTAKQKCLEDEIQIEKSSKKTREKEMSELKNKLKYYESRAYSEETEVMKGAVRALQDRLECSERFREQFFEEKCEYEEAENDARLMVQRLQAQLEAAQEMESLLSASLSQEQEFCRDLQRRLREYQDYEKQSRDREEDLIDRYNKLHEQHTTFASNFEIIRSQYSLCLFVMLLSNCWKQNMLRKSLPTAIVPYSPRVAAFNSIIREGSSSRENTFLEEIQCEMKSFAICDSYQLVNSETTHTEEMNESMEEMSEMDISKNTDEANILDVLSDREHYYLQQIEQLQHEKKALRHDFENGQAEDQYTLMNLKTDLKSVDRALQECQEEKCKLMMKLQDAECLLSEVDDKHNQRYQQLKREYTEFIDTLRHENDVVASQYEKRINELKNLCNTKEKNLSDLLKQQTSIQLELAPHLQRMSCSDSYHEDQLENHVVNGQNLVELVRDLVKMSSSLREKNFELKEKENAYMETINEADKIMSSHVNAYTKHIEQLEHTLHQKNSSLKNIEDMMKNFRNTVTEKLGSQDSLQLLDELMERYEVAVTNGSWISENNSLSLGVIPESRDDKSNDNEFWEKDQLLQKLMKLTSENNTLKSQLQESHDNSRRLNEVQQSANFLKGRLEELEVSEAILTEDRKKLELKLIQKEKKWSEKVCNLEEEIMSLKQKIEQSDMKSSKFQSNETCQKLEIDSLKQEIQILQTELKESSDETVNFESQHRSEVAKLRTQLKLVNSQLTEMGCINGDLREKLGSAEQNMAQAAEQLNERCKRHENDILELNLRLNQKDSRIEELEGQIQHINHSSATNELDFFFSLPVSYVNEILAKIVDGLMNCNNCQSNYGADIRTLMDASSNISNLVNGKHNFNESLHSKNESSSKEGWSTDGIGLSEDNTSESIDDANELLDIQAKRPSAPPRPRRDAKKRKKVKKSLRIESSLLQELKESARHEDIYWQMPKESLAILNELKNKVVELEDTICQKEEDIKLADAEAAELHSRLLKTDKSMSDKVQEVEDLKSALQTLRSEFIKTVEEHTRSRQTLQEKHKDEVDELTKKIEGIVQENETLITKSKEKNMLVNILLKTILLYVRKDATELINVVKTMAEEHGECDAENITLESICNVITVVLKKPDVVVSSNKKQLVVQSPDSPISKENFNTSKSENEIPAQNVQQTRIPKLQPGIVVHTKSCGNNSIFNCYPKSRIPRLKQLHSLFKRNNSKTPVNSNSSKFATFSKASSRRLQKSMTTAQISGNIERKPIVKQNDVKCIEKKIHRKDASIDKYLGARPEHALLHKHPLSKSYSHSSVVKSGVKTSDYSVNCATTKSISHSKEIPRPQNLKITRRVGIDGVVIAWSPMENEIAGFQVIVDGRLVQQVRSPKRTKALVNGLPFPEGFTIGLVAVSIDGRCSTPALVSYARSTAYKFPRATKQSLWGSEQKCIPACF